MQALIDIAKAISSLENIISEMDERIEENSRILGIDSSNQEDE